MVQLPSNRRLGHRRGSICIARRAGEWTKPKPTSTPKPKPHRSVIKNSQQYHLVDSHQEWKIVVFGPAESTFFHRLFLLHEVFATVAQFTTFGVIVDLGVEAWARAVGDYIIEGIA